MLLLRVSLRVLAVDSLSLHLLLLLSRVWMVVSNASAWHRGSLWLLVVVLIELMDVERASTLIHVDVGADWRLNLNGLCTVTLLSVELPAIHRLNLHHVVSLMLHS